MLCLFYTFIIFYKVDRKCYVAMRSLKIQTSYSMTKYVCKNDIDISPNLALSLHFLFVVLLSMKNIWILRGVFFYCIIFERNAVHKATSFTSKFFGLNMYFAIAFNFHFYVKQFLIVSFLINKKLMK